ncbi:MAG: hydrogenase maturation nickel metallochaperone HypA [Anaerolineae bacterium]|nr:hydrogenase maturation nickel metallochaperone HypA [Anaerolineae bacterium]
MHELSVTQALLSIVLEHAEKAGAKRVIAVDLKVGEISGVVDDSVRLYFEFLSRDTPAAGARLHFTHVRARLLCRGCGSEFEPGEAEWLCPQCGATGGQLIAGRELMVESIEVE